MLKCPVTNYTTNETSIVTKYVDSSLFVRHETVQVMSDVWDQHLVLTSVDENGGLQKDSVSGWYGQREDDKRTWEIDGNDAAFERYRARLEKLEYDRLLMQANSRAINPAVKGRVVKVVAGRTAKGTVGKVVVIIERPYGMGYRSVMQNKLGIATSPRKIVVQGKYGKTFENYVDMVWVWARNCEVETPEQVDLKACHTEATKYAAFMTDALVKQSIEQNVRNAQKSVA